MHDPTTKKLDDSTLRWGGLAGIGGSILMLITFGLVAVFVGMDITPEQSLTRFPEIRTARILGLVVLAAGALPHVATAPLSDLYHAPGVTPQDQATLVLLWHGTDTIFNALLFTGLVILPLSVLALGTAMLGAPGYGTRIGTATVALGVTGLAAAIAVLVGVPAMGALGVIALVVFHLAAGRTTLRLARLPNPERVA
jgi:hypothetical protein